MRLQPLLWHTTGSASRTGGDELETNRSVVSVLSVVSVVSVLSVLSVLSVGGQSVSLCFV